MSKKSAKRFLALLCTISLITTSLFVVEAADAAEGAAPEEFELVSPPAVPEGYTVVTPQTFGIQDVPETTDTNGNLTYATYATADAENFSIDKKLFSANIKITNEKNSNLYLYGSSGSTSSIHLLRSTASARYMRLQATLWSGSTMYVSEDGVEVKETWESGSDYYPLDRNIANVEAFINQENQIWITTEFVNSTFDTDDEDMDDLKLGIWFNGELYNNQYFYILDRLDGVTYTGYLRATQVISISSPVPVERFEDKASEMMDKYKVVTPLTYGVPDSTDTNGLKIEKLADATRTSIDKVLFSAKVRFMGDKSSNFSYLRENGTESGLQFLRSSSSSQLWLKNYMRKDSLLYVGDKGDVTVAYGGENYYKMSAKNVDGFTTFADVEFQLWVTTEFVKAPWLEEDEAEDDLKIGIWINGVLYNQTYLYVLDCKGITYRDQLKTSNMVTMASGMMGLSDMDVTAGEHTSVSGQVYTSDLVANKDMNGVMFHSDVRFEGQGGTLYYGCSADNSDKAIKLTSNEEGLCVSHSYGEDEVELGQILSSKVGFNLINNTFSLKLRTDIVDADADRDSDDIKLGIWINKKYFYCYIADVAQSMTASMKMQCEDNSSIVLGVFGEETPEKLDWCLDAGRLYDVEKKADMTRLSVDGVDTANKLIDEPGTYSIVYVEAGKVYMQDATAYRSYDLNDNNAIDIVDIVRMKKISSETTKEATIAALSASGRKAIDYDKSTWTADKAQETLRAAKQTLVETVEVKVSEMELMPVEQANTYGFEFLGGTQVMPIGGFYGPLPKANTTYPELVPNYISDEYFRMIEDCGVNLIVYSEVYYESDPLSVKRMLELGERYGIGITLKDRRYEKDLTTELAAEYLSDYQNYRAFCGVHAVDEPKSTHYDLGTTSGYISNYVNQINILKELGVWSFGNLLPLNNHENISQYKAYVEEWLGTCNVEMLMWDKYVHDRAGEEADYFSNMSLGREMAAKYNVPFWTFVQGGTQLEAGSNYTSENINANTPNEGQFLWNVNTCLAYGAKGISYFPLIQPDYFATLADGTNDFSRNGLIGATGEKNVWWYYAQTANRQIAAIDSVLMNSVHKEVIITSDKAKEDNKYSDCILDGTSWREMQNIEGDVMVGCFNYQGKSAFYVVNYDMENSQDVTMEFSDNYQFRVIQDATSSRHRADSLELTMKAGEGVLLVME